MAGQVPSHVIRARAEALRHLSDRKKLAYYRECLGRELRVLVQERNGQGEVRGLARNYVPVTLAGDDTPIGTEVTVRIVAAALEEVRGEIMTT
jgi:threonylcarbamoyladenosine tRNA methylthiotransferase MtaB